MASPRASSQPRAAATRVLSIVVVMVGVLALALGASVPETWWPHTTGQAFALDASAAGRESPCALIVGPAKDYCERGTATTHTTDALAVNPDAEAGWRLAAAGSGLAALLVWRRRSTAGQGRR
ncbi:hypothetical protein B5181_03210 [Streptomyces sp. 4F]|nr:hypothetical protein B5181_03210 [Streptomyces sp. 4F]